MPDIDPWPSIWTASPPRPPVWGHALPPHRCLAATVAAQNLGVFRDADVETVLREKVAWQASERYRWRRKEEEARVVLDVFVDAEPGDRGAESLRDLPLCFDPLHRRYALRGVRAGSVELENPGAPPEHDPMSALGDA